MLNNSNAGGSRPVQISHGVQAHVTKTLNDEGLSAPARGSTDDAHKAGLVDEVFQAVENASAGGGHATMNATLINGFAGDAGMGVYVGVTYSFRIGVGDP